MARKILVAFLALIMCMSALTSCTTQTPATTPAGTVDPTQTVAPSTDTKTPVDTSNIVNPFKDEVKGEAKKEHVMMETLPSSVTLVGTDFLPPIDNQGGVGSCAS
jgi:hypothetical protein